MLSDRCLSVLSCPVCNIVGELWSNSWMDQDKTWHAGRPQPLPHCVRWGPSSPSHIGAQPPIFGSYLLWPLGMEAGLGPGDFVLDREPAPPPQEGIFGPRLLWPNDRVDQDGTWHGGRPQPRRLCLDGDPAPLSKRGQSPTIFGPCLLWQNGCMDQDTTWYRGRPRPRQHCVRWGPSYRLLKKGAEPPSPIFDPCLLWQNGRMDQDGTLHGGGLWSRPQCIRRSQLPQKGHSSPPSFQPMSIVATVTHLSYC